MHEDLLHVRKAPVLQTWICLGTISGRHVYTSIIRPSKIQRFENRNSALRKYKFCTKKLQWCSKQTTQNSVLRKWKFCAQFKLWKFWAQKMENFANNAMKTTRLFCAKSGNSELLRSSRNSVLNSTIPPARTDI